MDYPNNLARLAFLSVLAAGLAARPLAGQGLGGSLAFGVYRSGNEFQTNAAVGAELIGRWASSAGMGVGLGARLLHSSAEDRGFAFLELRYAPLRSATRSVQPVFGVRAGLFAAEGEFDDDPLFGLQAGPLLGIGIRAGAGVSVTIAGEAGVRLDSNLCCGNRRFLPGLQVGLTLH